MEVTIAWWSLLTSVVSLVLISVTAALAYKSYYKTALGLVITWVTFMIFSPIKINATESSNATTQQNYTIESTKILQPKVTDTSFKNSEALVTPISEFNK